MANIKFSAFTTETDPTQIDFLAGYQGTTMKKISPSNVGGGATDLNGLSDCLVDTDSLYVGESPSSLSGNPQGNTTLGIDSGIALTTGFDNTFIGRDACKAMTDSDYMVVIGSEACAASASNGDKAVVIGYQAHGSSMGSNGVAIGYQAMSLSGVGNTVAIGYQAGRANSGADSVLVGYEAGENNQAAGAVSIGYEAGASNTSGTANTNIGYKAGRDNTTNGSRTLIGDEAGLLQTGGFNTGVGRYALRQGTGLNNTAVGSSAMAGNMLAGSFNTAVGHNSLLTNGDKSGNSVVGCDAARLVTTGSNNTILGYLAGDNLTTGSNNIIIGYDATASAVGVSDEITLGDSNIVTLRCAVNTITLISDERDKTDIQDIGYGLDLIEKLKPRKFTWNSRDGKKQGQKEVGFIAQELQNVDDEYLNFVLNNNPDKLEAGWMQLVPVLVKAIQELKAEVDALKAS